MENRANRYNGYHLDLLQEKQMEAMESISLLKNITNRRITDVKKVSNYELEKEYEKYIEFFNRKINTSIGVYGSDTDFVLYSILLFTTEVAYCVMFVYSLAERISQYQHSKSKEKFQNDYLTIMEAFRACSHKNSIKNHSKHDNRKKNNIKFIVTSVDFSKTL